MTDENEPRKRILDAAERLLLERGPAVVTMDEIASSVGMSKKTLYVHFANKDVLLEEVLARAFAGLKEALDAVLEDASAPFDEKLRRYVATVAAGYARMPRNLSADLARASPKAHARFVAEQRESLDTRFRGLLSKGIEAGAFRADVDPRLVTRMVQALMPALLEPGLLLELNRTPLDVFEAVISVILDGVRARPERRSRS